MSSGDHIEIRSKIAAQHTLIPDIQRVDTDSAESRLLRKALAGMFGIIYDYKVKLQKIQEIYQTSLSLHTMRVRTYPHPQCRHTTSGAQCFKKSAASTHQTDL